MLSQCVRHWGGEGTGLGSPSRCMEDTLGTHLLGPALWQCRMQMGLWGPPQALFALGFGGLLSFALVAVQLMPGGGRGSTGDESWGSSCEFLREELGQAPAQAS